MRSKAIRASLVLLLVGGAGILFAGSGAACTSFTSEAALSTVDFCFLFDCQFGAIGGLVDPCASVDGPGTVQNGQFFVDCPDEQ